MQEIKVIVEMKKTTKKKSEVFLVFSTTNCTNLHSTRIECVIFPV